MNRLITPQAMSVGLWISVLFLMSLGTHAQKTLEVQPVNGTTDQRKALLIGNRTYTHLRQLSNTERDVDAMATLLRRLNFSVSTYKNLDYRATVQAIAQFKNSLNPNDIALVYYSGHGIGTGEQTYLIPVEASLQCTSELEGYGPLSLNALITGMAARQVRNSFVFLDACRNLPLHVCEGTKSGETTQGLVMPKKQPKGNLIVFATGEGRTADDDTYDKTNSLFTAELLKYLATPNLGIREIMDKVLEGVETRSGGKQVPQKLEDLRGNFVFVKTQEPTPVAPMPARDLPPFMEMVTIPGGTFDMGSTEGKADEKPVHTVTVSSFRMGKYEVTVSQFAQFVAETNYQTDAEKEGSSHLFNPKTKDWENSTGINWRYDAKGNRRPVSEYTHPVLHVSYNDALAFCGWLSKREKQTYRLPTEAEWEYAAGNGVAHTKYSWGNNTPTGKADNVADETAKKTFSDCSIFSSYTDGYTYTSPVGVFAPNGLGLYDMSGNVKEWCSDWYGRSLSSNPTGPATGSNRVVRGGSWFSTPQEVRVTTRDHGSPSCGFNNVGFRVVSQAQ